MEEWRIIRDFPNYEISDLGRVRRIVEPARGLISVHPGYGHLRCNRYPYVFLRRDGKKHRKNVHKLVCLAFHGLPPTPKHEVAHWDDDPTNLRSDNLRWATRRENIDDYMRINGHGHRRGIGTITEKEAKEIKRLLIVGLSQYKIAAKLGITRSVVSHIVMGNSWAWVE